MPAWFDEELNPLFNLLGKGVPITQIDARQYGVVVFLVLDPTVRLFGADGSAITPYAAVVSLLMGLLGFALIARRYASDDLGRLLILAAAWFSAVPLLYVVAQHMVDAWQLCFISLALFLLTGSPRQQRWTGVPLGVATLTKLLPAFLLFYVCAGGARAARLLAIGVLPGIGQCLWPTDGLAIRSRSRNGSDTVARWSTHFENTARAWSSSSRQAFCPQGYDFKAGIRCCAGVHSRPRWWLPVVGWLARRADDSPNVGRPSSRWRASRC